MEHDSEYNIAFELAATSRYEEAEEKLKKILEKAPGHVPSLVLLGKVLYYRRRRSSSRRCFETALMYEPDNLPAYFGLQYYKERRWKLAASISFGIVLLASVGIFLFFTSTIKRELTKDLLSVEKELSEKIEDLKSFNKTAERTVIQKFDKRFGDFTDRLTETFDTVELTRRLDTLEGRQHKIREEAAVGNARLAEEIRVEIEAFKSWIVTLYSRISE